MIAPIMIACKKRYAKLATISIETFLEHHDTLLYVVVDVTAEKILSKINSKNLHLVPLGKYREEISKEVKVANFDIFKYDKDGDHDRAYSSLKPLIMDKVIANLAPQSKYILSLDADTLFSGNILDKIALKLDKVGHKFDLYMVERHDKRMWRTASEAPGSGFTLWKRESNFIQFFKKRYKKLHAGPLGGSQNLTNQLRNAMPSMLFKDPLLHMVSPDLENPHLTKQEILTFKPAYIHLHGANSYKRLLKFREIFKKEEKE